jgi:hypothetical protein
MTEAYGKAGQLGGLDLDALFASALPKPGADAYLQDASGHRAGPAWPAEMQSRPEQWAERNPSIDAGLQGAGPLGPSDPLPNEGIDTSQNENTLGSGCAESEFSAADASASIHRPTLHYRLHDTRNAGGSIIGAPGDSLAALLADLVQRYGARLDLESVREAFEERAAIMEFDAGMPREVAEHAAARALRERIG